MPNTTKVRTADLRLVVQMAAAKAGKSSGQRMALDHVREQLSRSDSDVFESPMNQGHGNTVDDYRDYTHERLYRVDGYSDSETVMASGKIAAISKAGIGGPVTATHVRNDDQ